MPQPDSPRHSRPQRRPALATAVVALWLLLPLSAHATEPAPRNETQPAWTLQVDPLTTALGFVHVQVERRLAPHLSIYLGPSLRLFTSVFDKEPEPFIGLGVEAGVRVFWNPSAPQGLWALVRGVVARLSTDEQGGTTGPGGYGSALVGYTWIFGGRWVLAAGAGVNVLHYTIAGMGPKGILPAAHTTFGVAF